MQGLSGERAKVCARVMLKPLRERRAANAVLVPLALPRVQMEPRTFHAWLSAEPEKEGPPA